MALTLTMILNTISQADIEFVKWNGDPHPITRTVEARYFSIAISHIFLFKYRRVSDPANFGIVRLYTETNLLLTRLKERVSYSTYTPTGKILSFTNNLVADDVYDITFTRDSDLDDDVHGVFMSRYTIIPKQTAYNY